MAAESLDRISGPVPGIEESLEPGPAEEGPLDHELLATLSEIARIATADLELRSMLQRITDALARRFGWDLVALVRVDRELSRYFCEALTCAEPTDIYVGYNRPLGSGVVGTVAASGEPTVIDDVRTCTNFIDTLPGARSEICVPVIHRGHVVALLNVESLRPAAFRGQLALVQAIADQIAGAIASARLYDETQRRSGHLESLTEISRVTLAGGQLDERLHRIASYLRLRFDLELVAILVSDRSGLLWKHRAIVQREPAPPIDRNRWPTSAGIAGRSVRTGQTQYAPDVRADPDYVGMRDSVRAELVVPLRFSEPILGCITCGAADAEVLTPEVIALLGAMGVQVAGAIELAVLNDRLAESQRALEDANRRLAGANLELHRQTLVDGLTGVANRRCFDERLETEWRRAARAGEHLALAIVDVDCFKAYNDALGHIQGDTCLRQLAEALSSALRRSGELVARYGGEEFVALMPRMGPEEALEHAETLRARIESLGLDHPSTTVAPHVTVSIGVVSIIPNSRFRSEAFVHAADEALYRAKEGGRNRVELGEVP
jgi:diguanylate cyclase (GGDEF)-like protein